MRWFEGQIPAAIAQAKQQKSLFVVYIHGENEDSQKMDKTWEEEEEVGKVCEEAGLVVMKFQAESDECKQFSVFYPVICIPCVYLISGESGTPLESVAGFASPSDLIQKIKKAMETLKEEKGVSKESGTSQQQADPTPAAPVAASQSEPTVRPQATPPDRPSSSSTVAAPSGGASSPASAQKESAQERAARMRQKMEEAHRRKEEQKKEADKQKEIERRKIGQEMQKADQKRMESQAKQVADDLRKQRMEDKVAREKVLQQLARDKADKKARFLSEKEQREQQKIKAQQEKEAERSEQARRSATQMDTVTIQFRMPDGSTMTNQFPSSAPLQQALDYVTENVGVQLTEFTMSTTYPRRNFGPDDMQTSFLDHGLAPRAAIVILPGRLIPTSRQTSSSQVSSTSSSASDGIFSWFLAPILFIYNFLYSMLFGTTSVTSSTPSPVSQLSSSSASASSSVPRTQSSGEEDSPSVERNFRNMGARPKSSYARRRAPASGGNADNFSRREGNIHRLNTQQADNDENNTWNGNSTQQM